MNRSRALPVYIKSNGAATPAITPEIIPTTTPAIRQCMLERR
ncbi:hypothetical protein BVRB_011270 [Beta vulgaris subsp. vulgaris]|uniref:Uncharacterized protein n=1 Tax=Beta vulgaris subsp. vulgaris TaxID=3555 RepID=A0A0J8B5X4_BETVV|nr:hypothetical protein BVRB_011270 [Beta vulgaris subsp. vulgaris]